MYLFVTLAKTAKVDKKITPNQNISLEYIRHKIASHRRNYPHCFIPVTIHACSLMLAFLKEHSYYKIIQLSHNHLLDKIFPRLMGTFKLDGGTKYLKFKLKMKRLYIE